MPGFTMILSKIDIDKNFLYCDESIWGKILSVKPFLAGGGLVGIRVRS